MFDKIKKGCRGDATWQNNLSLYVFLNIINFNKPYFE